MFKKFSNISKSILENNEDLNYKDILEDYFLDYREQRGFDLNVQDGSYYGKYLSYSSNSEYASDGRKNILSYWLTIETDGADSDILNDIDKRLERIEFDFIIVVYDLKISKKGSRSSEMNRIGDMRTRESTFLQICVVPKSEF